jgi:predicted N-acetyltransferase YhbS
MLYVPLLSHTHILEATHHTHALWAGDRTQAAHTAHVLAQLEAAGPEILRYVGLVERGKLLGSIKRYSLLLREGESPPLRAVGIGAVFTRPSARGRGVATTLVRAVLEEARDLGYAAALLYSDIEPAFYARLGFVPLPARDFVVSVSELPDDGALEVRRARPKDEDRVLAWHESAWRADPKAWLRPARSRALYRFFRWRNRIGDVWILSHRGRERGYLMTGPDDDARDLPHPHEPRLFWFDEVAAPGVPMPRIWATVRKLARRARAERVRGWLGPHGAPEGASVVPRPMAYPMIAPLVPELRVRPRRAWLDSFQHY